MVQKTAHRSLLLVRETPVDLLVWPEGTIMEPIDSEPIRGSLAAMMRDVQTPLFTGAVRYNAEAGGWANSSYLIGANGLVLGYYDKIHLAPFGEYAPFEEHLPFIARHIPVIGATAAGEAPKTFGIGSRRFGPLICFEVLFPWMAEHLRSDGADFLIVITNLGWFGRSNAIVQEHEIGRLRAIETRLPVVHCANTGFSGVFDPWGRFTEVGPVHERLTGATRVAAPASHPLPWGPRMCRVLSVAVAGVLLAIAVAAGLVKARRTNAA